MAKNKTTETELSVTAYLEAIAQEKRRQDVTAIVDMIAKHTGLTPKMWGTAIIGFGSYAYKYESGHEGTAPWAALSSRAAAISLYLASEFEDRAALLAAFGKHKSGKGCIYIQKLEDIDTEVLLIMVTNSIKYCQEKYPS